MKRLPIALAIAAITTGSTHAADVLYSSEDFSAGTPNYSINGVNSGSTADSWLKLQDGGSDIQPADALAGTDYDSGSGSRNGVVANSEPTHFTPGGTIPTGQHGFVSTSQNRNFTSNYPMTLVTDGVASLDVSLSFMFFALENNGTPVTAKGSAIITYSAAGDFSDTVQLASFGLGQPGSVVETPDVAATANTWSSLSLSFTEASAGITFTDTAKLRINRVPMNTSGALYVAESDTPTNHVTFLDDITVTGVPGSAPAEPFIVTITPAVDPVTGYDIQWPSQNGVTYSVLTSDDLAAPVETWTVLEAGLAPSPPQNSYNVPADGVRRFYVVKEITP